jgi:hypothetical protein
VLSELCCFDVNSALARGDHRAAEEILRCRVEKASVKEVGESH